jgi:hypothetical protein
VAALNPLYAVMIALAEADRWLYAREIGGRVDLEKQEVNSVLYTHRDLFVRTDEDKPRWQLADQYRKGQRPKPPAKLAGPGHLPSIAIPFVRRTDSPLPVVPSISSPQRHLCEACEAHFEGTYSSPIPLCSSCFEKRQSALQQFANYQLKLPTMKDFGLYDSD